MVDSFDFMITPMVQLEISRCEHFRDFENVNRLVPVPMNFSIAEILRPFFGANQVRKGESEVLALAYLLNETGEILKFILDDEQARSFVERNLGNLNELMTGTLGFLVYCCRTRLFSKADALSVIDDIKNSSFRVSPNILSSAIKKIEGCQ